MVPVSVRPGDAADELGNQISFVFVDLPCEEPDPLRRLRSVQMEMGDRKGAFDALATSFYIYPFDADLHKQAGAVYLEEGRPTEAVREFGVVVSLNPADAAGAHYDLARSLEASGNRAEAKREVLRSLEMAPGFEKAQELLLKLRSGPK